MKAIRNIYSNNLLKMLENKQDLISPFNELPPNGPLKLSVKLFSYFTLSNKNFYYDDY